MCCSPSADYNRARRRSTRPVLVRQGRALSHQPSLSRCARPAYRPSSSPHRQRGERSSERRPGARSPSLKFGSDMRQNLPRTTKYRPSGVTGCWIEAELASVIGDDFPGSLQSIATSCCGLQWSERNCVLPPALRSRQILTGVQIRLRENGIDTLPLNALAETIPYARTVRPCRSQTSSVSAHSGVMQRH